MKITSVDIIDRMKKWRNNQNDRISLYGLIISKLTEAVELQFIKKKRITIRIVAWRNE